MATEELSYQPELEQDAARAWPAGLVWIIVAGTAWLLFELHANSSLVAVVACLKFGWYDFRNGLWLWRTDPFPKRGGTHFWFYLALAFWKISLTAVGLTFGILIVTSSLRMGFPGAEILGAMFSLWVSCGLATVSTWLGCYLAWRRGVRVWVDSTVSYSRKRDIWPPEPFGTNKLHPLLLGAGVVAVTVSLVLGIIVGVALAEAKQVHGGVLVLCVMFGLIFVSGGLLVLTEYLARTIGTSSPAKCWTPAAPPEDQFDYWQ